MIRISLSEDQRSSESSRRRRTESERTITEANDHVGNSEERELAQRVYRNDEIDIDGEMTQTPPATVIDQMMICFAEFSGETITEIHQYNR